MNWTELLKSEIECTYAPALKLMARVKPDWLDWKPERGANWMTVAQLLKHITEACGASCRAFVTEDWGLPPGVKFEDLAPEEMLPPAEKLPGVESVDAAIRALREDRILALSMIDQAGEAALDGRMLAAPWAPADERPLGWHLHQMVQHLGIHKAQLYYYLKLRGEAVNTGDLWG